MKNVSRPWIFLPVELKNRELIARIFFAMHAVKAGFGVFVGRNGMNISRDLFPRGVYFDKCLSGHKVSFHDYQVNNLGNTLVSFDEEGLLYESEDVYLTSRISQDAIDLSTLIFLWGEEQERIIKTRYDASNKLMVTGGPRLDTWRPEFAKVFAPDISQLKARYGDFILVICNWGYGQAQKDLGHDPNLIYPDIPGTAIRAAFISLVGTLSKKFKDTTIVIRPHPSDLQEYWTTKAKTFPPNVTVIHEGSISPWIYAAKIVIHNNCTSGVEAWVGGTPVLAYCPYAEYLKNPDLYTVPVNNLGIICRDEEEVVANIRTSAISVRKSRRTVSDLAIEKFIYVDDEQLATEKILSSLRAMRIKPEAFRIPRYSWLKRVRALVGSGKWLLRDIFGKSGMHTLSYTRYKNPGITINELRDLVRRLAEPVDIQSDMPQIYQIDKDTFCIFSKEKLGKQDF